MDIGQVHYRWATRVTPEGRFLYLNKRVKTLAASTNLVGISFFQRGLIWGDLVFTELSDLISRYVNINSSHLDVYGNLKLMLCNEWSPWKDQTLLPSLSYSPLKNLALDVPTIGLCDAVPVWDRLPCAPPPITQGECKQLGCCYNSEEVPSCYYGNTGEWLYL